MEKGLNVMGGAKQFVPVARFETAGDVREMFLGRRGSGEVVLREEVSGPSAVVALGVEARRMEASFKEENVPALLRAIKALYPVSTLAEYAQQEDADLLDLMDLCDREEIPYSYGCVDSEGGAWVRPAQD